MMRFAIIIFVVLIITSCDRRIEKLEQIPSEFRGEWIDEFGKFKKVITDNNIYHYEIQENGVIDTIKSDIREIYKVKRKDCDDCTNYGIEVVLKDNLGKTSFLYLNQFHPRLEKFLELIEVKSIINPYDESREYSTEQIWKRDDF